MATLKTQKLEDFFFIWNYFLDLPLATAGWSLKEGFQYYIQLHKAVLQMPK